MDNGYVGITKSPDGKFKASFIVKGGKFSGLYLSAENIMGYWTFKVDEYNPNGFNLFVPWEEI